MDAPSNDTPSRRYHDVARFFRAYASAEKMQLVPQPASAEEIDRAERELGARFPMSYRWFQLEFGDVQDGPLDIYTGCTEAGPYSKNIVETNLKERAEAGPRLPAHLIAFSDNGGGDHLCFDTTRPEGDEYPVVWWDHELDEDQEPEDAAPSFLDWIEQELKEMAAEERPSVLDVLPNMYKQWMDKWVRRFRKDPGR
jgi:cell wall assembly regulator SMI1